MQNQIDHIREVKINGFKGDYTLREDGVVFSRPRKGTKGGRMKTWLDGCGYPCVRICRDGKCYVWKIHRMLMIHFNHHRRPDQNCINHKDGNKTNNSLSNLEWCNHSENQKHAYATGLR